VSELRRLCGLLLTCCCGIAAAADRPPSPPLPAAEEQVITLAPSDDPNPPVVVIGEPRKDPAWENRKPGEIVNFTLTDQLGREVTKESLLGTPWVANFIFSRCHSHCPATLNELFHLQRRLEDVDVKFVTITVDPQTDDVARMKELSKAFGADPERWLFLTGEPAEIQNVIMDGFKQPMSSNPMLLAHSMNLMHVDEAGEIIGQYRYHFQEPGAPDQFRVLEQVLEGEIETPAENRFKGGPQITMPEIEGPETTEAGDAAAARPVQPAADAVPAWVERLRTTNALLNGVATVLLLLGFTAILSGHIEVHKRLMLMAFGTSIAFLVCYLTYHGALKHFTGVGHKPYGGDESLLGAYRTILWSHIALAAITPILASITIYRGLAGLWDSHRRIARVTFPIWLYVSATGVIIYFMNA
jgi:protein SCO1/2/putative membrane protein